MNLAVRILCSLALLLVGTYAFPAQDRPLDDKNPFSSSIARRNAKPGASEVTIMATSSELSTTILTSVNGKALILSVPVEIKNVSPNPVTMRLNHEWYGGIPPLTDLNAAVHDKTAEGMKYWIQGPGYQVGNIGLTDKTTLEPGQTKKIDVRLNWPGTGSVPSVPLINDSVSGTYPVRFLLFFESQGSTRFVETTDVVLTFTAAPRLVEVKYSLDDKLPTEPSHSVRTLWLSSIQLGSSHDWRTRGEPVSDAGANAAKCRQLLRAALQTEVMPSDPNKLMTIRADVDGIWLTKQFAIDKLPSQVREILEILAVYDEDMRRFRFID